ncbi:MAG: hypothetical protein F6J87_12925 [Spirulina sp. SIO3F2]|nr:hypothetical protein [Spirulina sp. SIO3F2]
MTSSLETIAEFLEQHEDTLRVRKLLFCVCERRWENDTGVLRNLSLNQLVSRLQQKYQTFGQLSDALFGVVQQLNRQSQYARIAQTVLNQMSTLYDEQDSSEQTQFNFAPDNTEFLGQAKDTDLTLSFEHLAQNLDAEAEVIRIRKMIWCTCRQAWESNTQVLLSLDLPALLEEIQYTFPIQSDLQAALNRVVNSVSRPAEYSAIAQTILSHLELLYHAAPPTHPPDLSDLPPLALEPLPTDPPTDYSSPSTDSPASLDSAHLKTAVSPARAAAAQADTLVSPTPADAQADTVVSHQSPSPPPELTAVETEYSPAPETDFNSDLDIERDDNTAESSSTTAVVYDAFEVRLEVMKYANPLRAKIVAFSTLHHTFETRGQDWPHLRTQPFDQLLQTLYETYTDLETLVRQLNQTAEQLESPDDSLQAAEAIVKAMRPYYAAAATTPSV